MEYSDDKDNSGPNIMELEATFYNDFTRRKTHNKRQQFNQPPRYERMASISLSMRNHYTPRDLLYAASRGNKAVTEEILKIQPKWVDHVSDDGMFTVLMNACDSAKLDVVKVVVDAGADVDIENVDGLTGAMIAARSCHDEMLKYLLSNGAQVTKRNKSVLHIAVLGGSEECLDTVLSTCTIADIQYQIQGFDALQLAARHGNKYAVEQLLKRDPDGIKISNQEDKMTLLHWAAASDSAKSDLIEYILSQEGYDINAMNLYGNTPVAVAAAAGNVEKVKSLIDKGNADVTVQNYEGQTCLHLACKNLQSDISQSQFESFCELNKDIDNYLEMLTILLEIGCSVDDPDFDGNTPEDMITDTNIKAAVLARAKKVFKETTFTVEITSDKKTAAVELIQQQTFDKLTSGLDIVPHVSGDVVPFVPCVHINQWTLDQSSMLKRVCDIFASIGAIITSVAQGSVKLNAIVPTESTFEKIKEEIGSKEFHAKILKRITTDSMRKKATKEGSELELKLTQNYQKGQKYFAKSDKKSQDIHNSGGEVVVEKTGVSLKIPRGAIAKGQKIKLTVSVIWEGEHPPMQDEQCVIAPKVLLEPEGTRFLKPVTLTVPHCAASLPLKRLQVWQKQGWNGKWKCFFDGRTSSSCANVQVTSSVIKVRLNHFTLIDYLKQKATGTYELVFGKPAEQEEIMRYMHVYMRSVQDNNRWLVKICTSPFETSKEDHDGYRKCADPQPFSIDPSKDLLVEVTLDKPTQGWSTDGAPRTIRKACISKGRSKTQLWIRKDDLITSEQRSSAVDGSIKGSMTNSENNTSTELFQLPFGTSLRIDMETTQTVSLAVPYRRSISANANGVAPQIYPPPLQHSQQSSRTNVLTTSPIPGSVQLTRDMNDGRTSAVFTAAIPPNSVQSLIQQTEGLSLNAGARGDVCQEALQIPEESVSIVLPVDLNRGKDVDEVTWNVVGIRNSVKRGTVIMKNETAGDNVQENKFIKPLSRKLSDLHLNPGDDYEMEEDMEKKSHAKIEVKGNGKPVMIYPGKSEGFGTAHRRIERENKKITSTEEVILLARVKQGSLNEVAHPSKQCFIENEMLPCCEGGIIEYKMFDGHDIEHQILKECPTYVSSFANTNGGVVIFGVDDDGFVHGFQPAQGFKVFKERVQGLMLKMTWIQRKGDEYSQLENEEIVDGTKFECLCYEVKQRVQSSGDNAGSSKKNSAARNGSADCTKKNAAENKDNADSLNRENPNESGGDNTGSSKKNSAGSGDNAYSSKKKKKVHMDIPKSFVKTGKFVYLMKVAPLSEGIVFTVQNVDKPIPKCPVYHHGEKKVVDAGIPQWCELLKQAKMQPPK